MATAMSPMGRSRWYRVNSSRFEALTASLDWTLEFRFSGKLESLRAKSNCPSVGLTAPDEDPPLLAARKAVDGRHGACSA